MVTRTFPDSRFLTVTVAPGTGAGLWSMTTPLSAPNRSCPFAEPAQTRVNPTSIATATRRRISPAA